MNEKTNYAGLFSNAKLEIVEVKTLTANPKNIRTQSLDTSDMVYNGGIAEPLFIKSDGTVIKGHRRLKLATENNAKVVPVLRFKKDLEPEIVNELLHDHGQSKALTKAEAYKQLVEFFKLGYPETRVAELKAGLLNSTWSAPSEKVLSESSTYVQAVKKAHRSKLQAAKRMAILPEYVADEYISALEEGRKSITTNDIKSLEKTYTDTDGKNFAQVFEAVKQAKNEEAKTVKPKEEAKMLKKSDIEAMAIMVKDEKAIATFDFVLGKMSVEAYRKIVK